MTLIRQALLVAGKDLRIEARSRVAINQIAPFALLVLVLFAFALDPDRGVRLVSFAIHWIKAEIHEYILRNWRLVKVATTKAQRKLFFNLRSMKKGLAPLAADDVERVAAELRVKPEEVVEMETRLSELFAAWDTLQGRQEPADRARGEKETVLKEMREILSNRTYLRNILNDMVATIG